MFILSKSYSWCKSSGVLKFFWAKPDKFCAVLCFEPNLTEYIVSFWQPSSSSANLNHTLKVFLLFWNNQYAICIALTKIKRGRRSIGFADINCHYCLLNVCQSIVLYCFVFSNVCQCIVLSSQCLSMGLRQKSLNGWDRSFWRRRQIFARWW